jgi:DNA end-binding protein Ku
VPEREENTVDDSEQTSESPGARPFWSGTIRFGLIAVPVNLFPATRRDAVPLRMLAPSGVPVVRRYACTEDGKVIDDGEIVRGYEVAKGKHVVVTDEELERLAPEKTRDIDLRKFVKASDIDPVRMDRPYLLAPSGGTNKAYRLLADVLEHTELAGIATFVLRGRERLLAIFGEGGLLRGETLRFQDELRAPGEIDAPKNGKVDASTEKEFAKRIRALTKPSLAPSELQDPEIESLRALVERKRRKREGIVVAPREAREEARSETIDLLDAIRRSMGASKRGAKKNEAKRKPPKRAPEHARSR